MSADEQLDQDGWQPGGIVRLPEQTVTYLHQTAEQQIRAVAVQAAAAWLAGVDPYPQGRGLILDTAAEFAHWITTGDRP